MSVSRAALRRAWRRLWRGCKSVAHDAGSYLAYSAPMLPVVPWELMHPALRREHDNGGLGSEEDWSLWLESLDDPESWSTLDDRAP